MAVADLNDLFESVDGLTEDLMEYGIMAGSAVAAHIAFNAAASFGLSKMTNVPEWLTKYGVPAAAIVGGAVASGFAAPYVGRRVATGIAVGLVTAGLTQLVREHAPADISKYLGGVDEEVMINGLGAGNEELFGLGEGSAFDRYLGDSTMSVEQVNGVGSAVSFEQVNGMSVASSFQ